MVKRKVIWSPRAKLDLFKILDFYFKRNGNKTYSIKLNLILRRAIKLLETRAEIGLLTDIPGVKNLIKGNFCIFYRIENKSVQIITIWESSQNPDNHIMED